LLSDEALNTIIPTHRRHFCDPQMKGSANMASRAMKIDPTRSEGTTVTSLGEVEIAVLAYQFWQERGCPIGSDQEDWFRAEETLKNRRGSVSTSTR
jgi:hypothetical protein